MKDLISILEQIKENPKKDAVDIYNDAKCDSIPTPPKLTIAQLQSIKNLQTKESWFLDEVIKQQKRC